MASQPRILIVGCGGTGSEALLQVKGLFRQSPGKTPSHVGMLYLDTVAPKERSTLDDDCDYVQLVLRDASEMLRNPDNAYMLQWFPEINSHIVSSAHGAAQVRPMGRLTLHAQADRVLRQIRNCLAKLTSRERLRQADGASITDPGSVEVYVLASLCGGTGSGISLDVAQLLRQELKDAPHVRVIGIFLLPGPFRNLPGTDLVKSNAYAALKELDYLGNPRGKVDFTFGTNHPMALDRSPFDLIYLVDSIGEHYDTTQNVSQLARQIAHLPYLMSNPAFGPYVRETLHNLIPQLETKDPVQGKRAVYASFGVSSLEITEDSVDRARLDFKQQLLNLLLEDRHSAESLADLGAKAVLQRVGQEEFPESLEMNLLEFDFGNSREPIDKLQEIYTATIGLMEDHARRTVVPRLETLREAGRKRIETLLERTSKHAGSIRSTLRECMRLQTLFWEMQETLRGQRRESEHAEKERQSAWEFCQQEFKSRRRKRREPAAMRWKDVINTLVLPTRFRRTIDDLSIGALGHLIDRVQEAHEWCSQAIRNMEEALQRLSEANIPVEKEPGPFTRYCEVKNIRPQADAGRFLESLPDSKAWFQLSESEIRSTITSFEGREFAAAFTVGGASSATQLLLRDPHKSISELRRFSDPLWSYTLDKIPPEHHRGIHHIEVLGVDSLAKTLASLAGLYPLVHLVETGWWDRVTHLQIRAGIPLFALSCMNELWRDYSGSANGRREKSHLDRRWVGWPELLPHAFKQNVIRTFALGLACSEILRLNSGVIQLKDTSGEGRLLGQSFHQAYAAMSADDFLCVTVEDSLKSAIDKYTAADIMTAAGHLWDLLIEDRIAVHDRPLVETLARCLEQMARRWPVGVLSNYTLV
jgi:hypothetical protein